MKKLLILLLMAFTVSVYGQGEPVPVGFTTASPANYKVKAATGQFAEFLGTAGGWAWFVSQKILKVKLDSIQYRNDSLRLLKVDKVTGKKLSDKNYSSTDSLKLVGLPYLDIGAGFVQSINNPVIPNGIEGSLVQNGISVDLWYRATLGASDTIKYTYTTNATLDTYASSQICQLNGFAFIGQFPNVQKINGRFIMIYWSSNNLYMAQSSDKIHWFIMNSGNPVLAHSPTTTDQIYQIYNPAFSLVGTTYHLLIESHPLGGHFGIAYSYCDTTSLNFNTHVTNYPIISGAGNPDLHYIPSKNSFLTIYGSLVYPWQYWTIKAKSISLSGTLTDSTQWVDCPKFPVMKQYQVSLADPYLVETTGNPNVKLLLGYNHNQANLNQQYNNSFTLDDFFTYITDATSTLKGFSMTGQFSAESIVSKNVQIAPGYSVPNEVGFNLLNASGGLTPILNGTGFVKAFGTTISYDNSTYVPTSITVNGHALTGNISVTKTDLSLDSLTNHPQWYWGNHPTTTIGYGLPAYPNALLNQNSSPQFANMWTNGNNRFDGYTDIHGTPTDTVGIHFVTFSGGWVGFRTGTDYSFNIDTYNSGTALNALKILQSGAITAESIYLNGNCSALSFTDRTPFYKGDALSEIKKIRGKNGEIDHTTLPAFVQVHKKQDINKDQLVTKTRQKTTQVERQVDSVELKLIKGKYTKLIHKVTKVVDEPIFNEVNIYDESGKKILDSLGHAVKNKIPILEQYQLTEKVKVGEKDVPERDLGGMISVLTVAVQQLLDRIEKLESSVKPTINKPLTKKIINPKK